MKNLFEISEEEKNNIRGLHELHKDKPGTSLNEQGGRISGVQMTDKGKFDISRTKTKETGSLTGDKGVPEQSFDPNSKTDKEQVLAYYNDPKSEWKRDITLYIWDKIKWWDKSSKNAFNKILSNTPQILFNVTAQITDSSADSVLIKAQRVVIEDLGEKITTTPGKEGTPADIQYVNFNHPDIPGGTSDFFIDNTWTPTDKMKNYVSKEILEPIIQVFNEAKAKTGKTPLLFLNRLDVESSVSRFLNSIDNEGNPIPAGDNQNRMSFETLSTKRADAAIDYLKTVLKDYVQWDDSIVTKNTKGGNGDGSTGDDPYKEAQVIIKNPNSNLKSYKAVFDSPGFRQKYDKNKFTKFTISIGVIPISDKIFIPGKPPEPGDEIKSDDYKFLFFYKDNDWDFTLKLPKFDWKYTSSAKAPGFWNIDTNKCNLKWWEKLLTGKYFVPKEF